MPALRFPAAPTKSKGERASEPRTCGTHAELLVAQGVDIQTRAGSGDHCNHNHDRRDPGVVAAGRWRALHVNRRGRQAAHSASAQQRLRQHSKQRLSKFSLFRHFSLWLVVRTPHPSRPKARLEGKTPSFPCYPRGPWQQYDDGASHRQHVTRTARAAKPNSAPEFLE
jgi:hypothetical protein